MSRFPFGLRASLGPLLGLLLACGSANAATYTGNSSTGYDDQGQCTTIGGDNGDFSDARNWGGPCTPGTVPGAGDTADLAGHGVHGTTVSVGTLQTGGGTLTADSITVDNLIINRGAVSGRDATASTLTVNTSVSWTDGAISTIQATFGPSCTATISGDYNNAGSGSGGKYINGNAVLNNQGTLTWSGSAFSGTPGTINNSGTFNMASDGPINWPTYGSGVSIINSGSFIKTGGTGTTGISGGGSFTSNGGTLGANIGVFDLTSITGNGNGPTKLNGNITIAAGAGAVQQSDGYFINGNIIVNGTWRFVGGASVGQATFSGPGRIDWQGGGFGNDYTGATGAPLHSNFVLATGFHADMSGPNNHNVGALTNLGTLTWKGPGNMGGGLLTNKGAFNLLSDGPLGESNGGLTPAIINTGTIAKTGGTGAVTTSYHYLDNSGTIDIQRGSLVLNNNQNGGNDVFRNGTVIKGAGKLVNLYTGVWSGTATIDGTLELSGNIYGPNTIKGVGKIEWLAGTLGGVNIAPGFTVNASGTGDKAFAYSASGTGDKVGSNAGTINWKGGAGIGIYSSYTNTGTLNALATGNPVGGTLINKGTFNTLPGGFTGTGGTVVNTGTINLGTLAKPGTYDFYGNDPNNGFTNTGTINVFIAGTKASEIRGISDANAATQIKLGGKLAIALAPGTTPTAAQQFVLLKVFPDRAGYSQKFATVTGLPTVSGRAMKLLYHSGDVTLFTPLTISGKAVRWVVSNGTLTQQGIGGTSIGLTKAGGDTAFIFTNGLGAFAFHDLEPGSYSLTAFNNGVTFDPPAWKLVLPTVNQSGISPDAVYLFQTYSVTARVVDPQGKSVSGVTVKLANSALSKTATTNPQGYALFSDIGLGQYGVAPQAQTGFTFSPTQTTVKLPTTGKHNVSPNASISFTRTPKPTTKGLSHGAPSPSAGSG